MTKDFLLVIGGPTASGKTSLSVDVAKRLNKLADAGVGGGFRGADVGAEIISADSMQIYKELFIGTARPTEAEMSGIPHHMIGIVSIAESYSVAKYAERARELMSDIWSRGGLPILCGGTGLYINSIVDNILFSEEISNEEIKQELVRRAEAEGLDALCDELREIDPEAYERIDLKNPARVVRAIEIYRTCGITMSEQIRRSKAVPPSFSKLMIFLDFKDRKVLYERINRRVDIMLEQGLLDEVRQVVGWGGDSTAAQAIGYKELIPYIKGEESLESCVENLKKNTRRYAKRQLTWFRKRQDKTTFYVDDYEAYDELLDAVISCVKEAF